MTDFTIGINDFRKEGKGIDLFIDNARVSSHKDFKELMKGIEKLLRLKLKVKE